MGTALYLSLGCRRDGQPQPWVMYAPTLLPHYPDEHERWMHEQFTQAGIAVAGIDVGEAYGSPLPSAHGCTVRIFDQGAWFRRAAVVLAAVAAACGQQLGRSGPATCSSLAGIYPVFDLNSYPGIDRAAEAYQLTPERLRAVLPQHNPLARAEALARLGVPAYIVHGAIDEVVPLESNSAALAELYRQHGQADAIQLEIIPDQGHNYWPGFFRSQGLVDFVKRQLLPQ